MKQKGRARLRVATRRAQEVACLAENLIPSVLHSTARHRRIARTWAVNIQARARLNGRRYEYVVNVSDGVIFVGLFGNPTTGRHAAVECEFRGMLRAFEWLKHEAETPCEIRLSSDAFDVFMGEAPCPSELKSLLDEVRRAYITSADALRIDRERHALVSKAERLVA